MLTRLKVNGFKNLVDVDVRFGPFTCIAGANGVGKSNLFDVIRFLSALTEKPLLEAAQSVRDEGGRSADVRGLFYRVGDTHEAEMSFEAEMIIPASGIDFLGQTAKASITFLRYSLSLRYRDNDSRLASESIELLKEQLDHITLGDAPKQLLFPNSPIWRESVITGRRTAPHFISTDGVGTDRIIKLHQDSVGRGRPLSFLAANLPRTVLSTTNAAENRTALLARKEMMSWRLLQLEPSALRRPDEFTAPTRIGPNGAHLAATLYHLARNDNEAATSSGQTDVDEDRVYGQVANKLAELIDDVRKVSIDRDERRELLTLQVTSLNNTSYPARALSDGTLRFLALAVLDLDPDAQGVLCLEEPENGIHPGRIPAMLGLLRGIAVDVNEKVGPDNPLRQVIINTHSPSVVKQISDDSLLVAESIESLEADKSYRRVRFSCLRDTWRAKAENSTVVSRGSLLAYLNPDVGTNEQIMQDTNGFDTVNRPKQQRANSPRRVMDRPDLQMLLPNVDDWK
jgi:predicted ATPase